MTDSKQNKGKPTSSGLKRLMEAKGLQVTGEAERDLQTCKESGKFPNWSDRSEQAKTS